MLDQCMECSAKEIEIGRFLLIIRKDNWEGWTESKAHLEPSQASLMELFRKKKKKDNG